MRNYILNNILSNFCFINSEGKTNSTTSIEFLFSYEILELKSIGFEIMLIDNTYNLIIFKNNKMNKEKLREKFINKEITLDYLRGMLDAMRIDMETYLFVVKEEEKKEN